MTPLVDKVWRYCEDRSIRPRTATLKVKYADFQQITRSRGVAGGIAARSEFEALMFGSLDGIFPVPKGVRLLGVTLSNLGTEVVDTDGQLSLID